MSSFGVGMMECILTFYMCSILAGLTFLVFVNLLKLLLFSVDTLWINITIKFAFPDEVVHSHLTSFLAIVCKKTYFRFFGYTVNPPGSCVVGKESVAIVQFHSPLFKTRTATTTLF